MPLRQTIGISLALIMASTAAMAKTPEKGAAYQSSAAPTADPAKPCSRSGKARFAHRGAHFRWPSRLAFHRSPRGRDRHFTGASIDSDSNWVAVGTVGYQQIGQAAWYDLVGARTSNGERLDTETLTAAHRSLPLGSCAKVTSLDTGRSVIVRINDRGPYNRRFIIDLSPRAAAELGVMRTGVAAVAVEPVAAAVPTNAAMNPTAVMYRAAGNNVTP
jgi:rare lipoprotein A